MEEMISSLILYALMVIVVVLSIGKWKSFKDFISKLGIKKTNVGKGLATAILYLVILIAVSTVIGIIMQYLGFKQDLEQVTNVLKGAGFASLLIVLTVASFVEEVFFRGYLQRKTNILFASFIFGYFHIIYGSLSEIVGAFFLGLVLGKEYDQTKNLFAPILSHFFYNLVTIMLIFA
jgi:membrane protease YdiL (CAAX protease family)